jgi:hypothetical protein
LVTLTVDFYIHILLIKFDEFQLINLIKCIFLNLLSFRSFVSIIIKWYLSWMSHSRPFFTYFTLTFLTTSWTNPLASLSVPLQNPRLDQARRPPISHIYKLPSTVIIHSTINHTKYLILCCNYNQQIN